MPVDSSLYWDEEVTVDVPSRSAKFHVYKAGQAGAVVFCIHGGGYTGLTWSLVAKKLKDKYRVIAPDLRCHGLTVADGDDLSAQALAEDVVELWTAMFGAEGKRVPTVLVGHSMGGAAAVWAAASKKIPSLDGVVVIDVVEGTALAALPHMMAVLSTRPQSFPSQEAAVAWALRSGMSKCREAAAISIPAQLHQQGTRWVWRTDLERTQQYWEGWYKGLSATFLGAPAPKVLLLAGTDRLDRELTIGQMQGKFQLVVLPAAGHAVQEDEADKTAESLLQFLHRFRVGEPPMQFPRALAARPVLPVVAGPPL